MFEFYRDNVVSAFKEWKERQEKFAGYKISVQQFDSWLCGYIIGISSVPFDKEIPITEEEAKLIADELVKSDVAKSIGITGTEKETFSNMEL